MCKKLKFDHTNKWYIHNSKSVQENEAHKLLQDFEMQTDHLISTRLSDSQQKKRTCRTVDFADPTDLRVKFKERKKRDKYIDPDRELEKTAEHESNGDTNCKLCARYRHQRIDKETGGLRNKRASGDHPNYNIVEIGQNTKKSPRDLRRLVTQTPIENY